MSSALLAPDIDVRLALAARDGDHAALTTLVARHDARLRHLCARILGNSHDADDAVQEVWLRVLAAIRRITPGDVSAWLSVIARNEARRLASGRRPGAAQPLEQLSAPLADDPHEQACGRELGDAVAGALRALTPGQREVAVRDALGQRPAEAAAALGVTPVALRVRRHRARASLQEALADAGLLPAAPPGDIGAKRFRHDTGSVIAPPHTPPQGASRWPSQRTTSTSSRSRPRTRTSAPGRTSR
ncbi:MAG TPA: sigma-70 family RNA polymerase sigma factor [Miltoncostaeaceae bacterium]|nr:sigma-70 family RNA polymerase sigma factor [Miltoncostaeaceae bacterium]